VNLTTVDTAITVTSTQTNRILVVGIYGEKSTSLGVSSVLGAGGTLTQEVATTTPTTNSSTWQIWYLLNPASGAQNVTTTFTASASVFEICAATFYNVSQTHPFDTSEDSGEGER
jgi:hypothetical protein